MARCAAVYRGKKISSQCTGDKQSAKARRVLLATKLVLRNFKKKLISLTNVLLELETNGQASFLYSKQTHRRPSKGSARPVRRGAYTLVLSAAPRRQPGGKCAVPFTDGDQLKKKSDHIQKK